MLDINYSPLIDVIDACDVDKIKQKLQSALNESKDILERCNSAEQAIKPIEDHFKDARERAFNELSRQAKADKKGSEAQRQLDTLCRVLITQLTNLKSKEATDRVLFRQRQLTHIEHVLYTDLFSVTTTLDLKKAVKYMSIIKQLNQTPGLLDGIDFEIEHKDKVGPISESLLLITEDKAGLLFDFLGAVNLTYSNPNDVSDKLNECIGVKLFSAIDIHEYRSVVDPEEAEYNLHISKIPALVKSHRVKTEDTISEIESILNKQDTTLVDAYNVLISKDSNSEAATTETPEPTTETPEPTTETPEPTTTETPEPTTETPEPTTTETPEPATTETPEPTIIETTLETPADTLEALLPSLESEGIENSELLSVAQVREEVRSIIGDVSFANIEETFSGIEYFTQEDILTIFEFSTLIANDHYIPSRLSTLILLAEFLLEKADILASIFGDEEVTFFPYGRTLNNVANSFRQPGGVIDDGPESGETRLEPRNQWFTEWLNEHGFTFSSFEETEVPGSRQSPFIMYHVVNDNGDSFLALICDEIGNSNCFINSMNTTVEQACRLAQQSRRDIFRNPNVVFRTNHINGELAFKDRLNELLDLKSLFTIDRFIESINANSSLINFLIQQDTFNLSGLEDVVSIEEQTVCIDLLPNNVARLLFDNLYVSHTSNPDLYPFNLFVHQLGKCLSRLEDSNDLDWNVNFPIDNLVQILSLRDLYPRFTDSITIDTDELTEFFIDLDTTFRIKSKKLSDRIKLALGTLYYQSSIAGDEQRATYYFLKYKSFKCLTQPFIVNEEPMDKIESIELLEHLFNPYDLESSRVEPTPLAELESLNSQYLELPFDVIKQLLQEYISIIDQWNKNETVRFRNYMYDTLIELIDLLIKKAESDSFDSNQAAFEDTSTELEPWQLISQFSFSQEIPETESVTYDTFMRNLYQGVKEIFHSTSGRVLQTIPSQTNLITLLETVTSESHFPKTEENVTYTEYSMYQSISSSLKSLGYEGVSNRMDSLSQLSTGQTGQNGFHMISVAQSNRRKIDNFLKEHLFGKLNKAVK